MMQYILSQDQLERMQDQIQLLSKLSEAKQERIESLEQHKIFAVKGEIADLLRAIEVLKNECRELEKANEKLHTEINWDKVKGAKIKELEMLLEQERKVRRYSETLAQQMEAKYAEEYRIKELTSELCQLQKDEMAMNMKRLQEMQNMLNSTDEAGYVRSIIKNEYVAKRNRENVVKIKKLKSVVEQLETQLLDLQSEIENNPVKTKDDQKRLRDLKKWLMFVKVLPAELNEIESLRKNLKYMKTEIENRRKSF